MDSNKTYPAFIGRITEIVAGTEDEHGCPTQARVVPITRPDAPTSIYSILYIARGPICNLEVDDEVWCLRAESEDGLILCKKDGESTNHFPGQIVIERGGVEIHEGDVTVDGGVAARDDVTAGAISLQQHHPQGVHGPTGPAQ